MSVAGAVSLTQRIPFWSTWSEGFLWTAAPGYFVGALAAAGIAYYYAQVHLLSFAVTLPALYLSYRSYKAYIGKVEETQTRLEEVQALYKESLQLVTQAEKLASIGRLAGGVAHEINNPLMVILGRAELALMDVPEDHASAADLEIIISETKRIANIVKNLLRFSRQDQQESLLPVDVNETVDRAVELTRYQLTVDNVVVETRYAPDLPTVMGNAGQLQQVFTNIIINALPGDGGAGRPVVHRDRKGGRSRGGALLGFGLRHPDRPSEADLRAVLHHQGRARGHGPGAFGQLRDHRRPRRQHHRGQRGGRRQPVHRPPPRRPHDPADGAGVGPRRQGGAGIRPLSQRVRPER